jgi:hypothetical protein
MAKGRRLKKSGGGELEVDKENVVALDKGVVEQIVVTSNQAISNQNVVASYQVVVEQNVVA